MHYMYNLRKENMIRLTTVSIQNTVFSKCCIIYIDKMRFYMCCNVFLWAIKIQITTCRYYNCSILAQIWHVLLVVKETDVDH